ncbi:MAG: phosphatase PAP2 family protein [Jatrophihabitans sp.]|nr:MAG: phosphatase PAP2 family protein [Jatrophihabitans sp.]
MPRISARRIAALVAVAVTLFVLGLVAGLVLVGRHGTGPIASSDVSGENFTISHRVLVPLAKVIAVVGDAGALGVIAVVATLIWFWRERTVRALVPVAAYLGGEGLVFGIREVIHRYRPPSADFPGPHALSGIHETSWSFPSGHATACTAVLVACLGCLALARRTVWPWLLALLAAAAVGYSRLDLGVHWPSDVYIGFVLGAAWGVTVAVVATALVHPDRRKERPRQAVTTPTSMSGPSSGP